MADRRPSQVVQPKSPAAGDAAGKIDLLHDADIPSLALLRARAFADKRPFSCCCGSACEMEHAQDERNAYAGYCAACPQKLGHCAVVRNAAGAVVAACQLQLRGDPGDATLPAEMRHKLREGEAYVEWLAVDPSAQGQGLGSHLLAWADGFAREHGATFISLDVMASNPALRLYQRKGYEVVPGGGCCDWFFSGCVVFWCMGCRYWTVKSMEKRL